MHAAMPGFGTRRFATILLAGAAVLFSPSAVVACTCGGWTSVEREIRDAPFIVVARVVSTGAGRPAMFDPVDPASVEIEIAARVKGDPLVTRLRLWNPMAGTSCGGALASLKQGMDIVLGMQRVSARRRDMKEFFDAVNFAGRDDDWILHTSACPSSIDTLLTDRQRRRWLPPGGR